MGLTMSVGSTIHRWTYLHSKPLRRRSGSSGCSFLTAYLTMLVSWPHSPSASSRAHRRFDSRSASVRRSDTRGSAASGLTLVLITAVPRMMLLEMMFSNVPANVRDLDLHGNGGDVLDERRQATPLEELRPSCLPDGPWRPTIQFPKAHC